jgi:hypothetical protein
MGRYNFGLFPSPYYRIKESKMSVLEYIGSLGGITGVLAFLIFLAYKYLVSQMREDRKFMEDRLSKIIDAYNSITQENTKILTELITYLKMKNGSK